MKNKNEKLKRGGYIRKSSEAEDRQAQSMPDQIRDLEIVASREKFVIDKMFPSESQSAFTIGRPIFANLVESIMSGEINVIFTWHANRLARNPVDAGMIIWLMDIGKLKMVQTIGRTYYNTASDKFSLHLDFGISKKDSDEKSEVVKRALEGRAKRGLPNGIAHIGYINDQTKEKGNRDWLKDEVRYPLVKKILTMMLSGNCSVRGLHIYARDELKLTTPIRKKEGGKPISLSYIYTLLKDPVHAGFFFQESSGEKVRYEFKTVENMITEDEYWKIQDLLGKKGVPRITNRKAVYNHFAKCGACNGQMSTDFKFQVICTCCKKKFAYLNRDTCPFCNLAIERMVNPKFLSYIFYYCINDKKHRTKCPNNGIEEKNLEGQLIIDMEQNLAISKELSQWCIDNVGKLDDEAIEDKINLQKNLEQEKKVTEAKLKRLTMLRISNDFSQEESTQHDNLQKELNKELSLLELKMSDTKIDWMSEARKDFDLLSEVISLIKNGTVEQKKDLLHALRSNLTVSSKKLTVTNKKSIEAFKKCLLYARSENKAFEPEITLANKDKTEVFASVCPTLLGG